MNSEFFKQLFSGATGHISSKRVLGAICLLTCMGVIIYLAIQSKDSDNVKSLLEMMIGVSALLLGISSVTSIWKKIPNSNNNDKKNEKYE